jgi:polyphenol oxidase
MGSLATAGKDPLFYAHHLNIDRLWWLWLQLPAAVNGNERANPTSTDWLNSQFAFYDENAQLVM